MNFVPGILAVGGVLGSALAFLPIPVACGIGLLVSLANCWIRLNWPTPKPTYLPVIHRPKARKLGEERRLCVLVGGAMILAAATLLLLLPNIMPATFMTPLWAPIGANFVGQGIGVLISGWIAAPKEVAEHNAWLARMGGHWSDD